MSPAMGRGAAAAAGVSVQIAIIADEKSSGTAGGTFTSGSWQTRDLNTEQHDPDGLVSISSNQFTLQSGRYRIDWVAPVFDVGEHSSRLYDVTNTAAVNTAPNVQANASNNVGNTSAGSALVDISDATAYSIQHQCGVTNAGDGFGRANSFGGNEVYTQVTITRYDDAS